MTRSRVFISLVVLALLWTQALGFAHRYVHAADDAHLHQHEVQTKQVHEPSIEHDRVGWLAEFFAGHEEGNDCRILDSVAHDLITFPYLPMGQAAPPLRLLAATHGDFVARWAALFDARGPPVSR